MGAMEFSAEREGRTALANAAKLATSLLLTWGVALVITFKLPKYLGPLALGWYRYGSDIAATLAVFLHLGVDTYISREIPVRPKHAGDQVEHGRLAGAVGADQADDRPFGHREAQAADCVNAAEGLADPGELEEGHRQAREKARVTAR